MMPHPVNISVEKLKPMLHEKIEHMDAGQLSLLHRVLLQVEAEELADRLNDAFDSDHEQGKFRQLSESIQKFRAEPRARGRMQGC